MKAVANGYLASAAVMGRMFRYDVPNARDDQFVDIPAAKLGNTENGAAGTDFMGCNVGLL